MSYTYRVLEVAANEVLEAALWYNDKRAGLGDDIILSFEASLNTILRNPFLFQVRYKKFRIVNIN